MSTRMLPTILSSDVKLRNTAKSCYITRGTKVYDITEFLDDHPGGADLILEYGGKDVGAIMGDEISHTHSDSAYEIFPRKPIRTQIIEPTNSWISTGLYSPKCGLEALARSSTWNKCTDHVITKVVILLPYSETS